MSTAAASFAPASAVELALALREGGPVRIAGGATKLAWGRPIEPPSTLSTQALHRLLEHSAGDLTAIVQAGAPLAAVQTALAEAGQLLALDPPLGDGGAATVGGVMASGDSGPLRHRYGTARDLVVGVEVALGDGTLARSGGRVIKNVAGYDLAKLLGGSFGTLGVITEVCVRLHPRPARRLTVCARGDDPQQLAAAALALGHAPLELESLDVSWAAGEGAVLARLAGTAPEEGARKTCAHAQAAGLRCELVEDDEPLWERQRAGQRCAGGTVVRVAARQTDLPSVLRAAQRLGAALVGRAALGLSWLRFERADADHVRALRTELAPATCTVLDAPQQLRAALDPWPELGAAELALTRRVKARFDPRAVCNPGLFVAG